MKLSLRERHKRRTAQKIQRATLELAIARGLDNTTTESIAERAGISLRTFFNYYPNKEAAAVSTPPAYEEEDKAVLRAGKGNLAADLEEFLRKQIRGLAGAGDTLRMVRKVVGENEKARGVLEYLLAEQRDDLAECISGRVEDPLLARTIADNAASCMARAIFQWETGSGLSLEEAFDMVWKSQIAAFRVFAEYGE